MEILRLICAIKGLQIYYLQKLKSQYKFLPLFVVRTDKFMKTQFSWITGLTVINFNAFRCRSDFNYQTNKVPATFLWKCQWIMNTKDIWVKVKQSFKCFVWCKWQTVYVVVFYIVHWLCVIVLYWRLYIIVCIYCIYIM